MTGYRWTYFLNRQELIGLYKAAGGTIDTFDTDNVGDILHARRAIFGYLMPGRVQVWYADLDGDDGVAFLVGKPVFDIRKAVKRDLAKRCWNMFEQCPNPCEVVENSGGFKLTLIKDG
ncbi:hypothetical protein FRC11_000628, partial [Ceratobasidium sp. 423]